jgi:hypothetical protein
MFSIETIRSLNKIAFLEHKREERVKVKEAIEYLQDKGYMVISELNQYPKETGKGKSNDKK